MEGQRPAAGWYPAPEGGGRLRYWDGGIWTDQYRDPAAPAAGERYRSLLLVASIFRVLAWVVAILGTIGVIASAAASSSGGAAIGIIIGGGLAVFIYTVSFFAAAAFIHLAIDVEDNTRRTADLLTQRG